MSIILNDNLAINTGKPVDSKYLNVTTPWISTSAVNLGVPISYRYTGLTVNIGGIEYWYKNGVADINLISKSLVNATNGINISGTSIQLGGTLIKNTLINVNNKTFSISGDTNFKGIQYTNDLSGNYVNRSLVDKEYVDTIAIGLKPKMEVRVATTGNIALTGLITIDGITVINGDRVLVKDQISSVNNGVYIASASTWNRASDFISGVLSGSYMWIFTGNTNGNTAWVLTTPDPITIGVSSLNFVLFNKIPNIISGTGITVTLLNGTHTVSVNGTIAGNSLTWNGTQLNVNISGGTLNTVLGTKLDKTSFTTYTGNTNTRIGTIELKYITGATNGLNKTGKNISLGGILTGNTIFDGGVSKYNLKYGNDYSTNFSTYSLVDVNYVTGYSKTKSNVVDVCLIGSISYTASTNNNYIGAQSGSTIYLPSVPKLGQKISVSDISGCALVHNIIINGNGKCINGNTCFPINTNYGSISVINNGNFWSAIAFIN